MNVNTPDFTYEIILDIDSDLLTGKVVSDFIDGLRVVLNYYDHPNYYCGSEGEDIQILQLEMNSPLRIRFTQQSSAVLLSSMMLFNNPFVSGFFYEAGSVALDYLLNNQETPQAVLDASKKVFAPVAKSNRNASVLGIVIDNSTNTTVNNYGITQQKADEKMETIKKLEKQKQEELYEQQTLRFLGLFNRKESRGQNSLDKGYIVEINTEKAYPLTWIDIEGKSLLLERNTNLFQEDVIVDVTVVKERGKIKRYKIKKVYLPPSFSTEERQLK